MSDVCLPRETHDIDPSSPRAHAFTYAVLAADRPSGSSSFCPLILSCPSPYLPFCGASQTPRYRSSHLAPFGARHIATGTPRDAPSCFGELRIRWRSPLAPALIPIVNLPYPLPHFRLERSTADPEHQILTSYPGRLQGCNATPVGPYVLNGREVPFLHLETGVTPTLYVTLANRLLDRSLLPYLKNR